MSKWCEVKCNCPNRIPIVGSNWWSFDAYKKHEKKPLIAKTKEEWEEMVKGMYECGHRDGVFIQFWQGDILKFGYALEVVFKSQPNQFEIFRRISNWRNYKDECLILTAQEAKLWRLEVEELKGFISGKEFLGWHEKEVFERTFGQQDLLYGDIKTTLENAIKLCETSEETNNSIEFFW